MEEEDVIVDSLEECNRTLNYSQTKNELKFNEAIDHQEDIINALRGTPVGYKDKIITSVCKMMKFINYQTCRISRLEGRLEAAMVKPTPAPVEKASSKEENENPRKARPTSYALAVYPKKGDMPSSDTNTIIHRNIKLDQDMKIKNVKKINKGRNSHRSRT